MMNLTQIELDVLTEVYNQMDEGDTKVRMDDVVSAASTEVEEGEELEEGEYSSSRVYGTLSTLQRKDMLHVTREADPEDPKGKKVKYIVPKGQYAAMVGEVEPQDIAAQQAEETEITAPTRGLEARTSTRETRMKRLVILEKRATKAMATAYRAQEEYAQAVRNAKIFGDVEADFPEELILD